MIEWQREDGRIYAAWIAQDALDDWVVCVRWGSVRSGMTGCRIVYAGTKDDALETLSGICARRIRRGYKLVRADSLGQTASETSSWRESWNKLQQGRA